MRRRTFLAARGAAAAAGPDGFATVAGYGPATTTGGAGGPVVHVYDNCFRDNSYGIASTNDAGLFVECNYFVSVNNPGRVDFSGPLGRMVRRDNILADCNHAIEVRGAVTDPRTFYPYAADGAASVPTIVPAGAGVGKV